MNKVIGILVGFVVAFGVDSRAALGAVHLGVEQAVEHILSASQDIKKAELSIKRAEAVFDTARAARFPTLDALGAYSHNVNIYQPGKTAYNLVPGTTMKVAVPDKHIVLGLDAKMPIYTFGKIGYGLDAARSSIKIAEHSAELARREMRVAAVELYYGAKMTQHILDITKKSLDNARKNQRALTAGAGRANKANLLKISTDIAVKESQVNDAKFNADSAMRMLKIMADIDDDIILADDIPAKFSKVKDVSISDFPEWDIYQETYNAARASMKSKYAGWAPTLAATGQYNYYKSHSEWDAWNGVDSQDATIGLALTIPILDGGAARFAATQDARAADIAMQDLDYAKKIRRNELDDAIEKHNYLIENLKVQSNALDLAKRTYKMSADRFASGQTSAVELSDVEVSLVQLEIALLDSRRQVAIAAETIRKLVGEN